MQAATAKRGLLFPWDSTPSDLNTKGWDKAGCPKAAYVITWELWKFGTQDPALEFIPLVRTRDGVGGIDAGLASVGAKKLAFLNGEQGCIPAFKPVCSPAGRC